MARLAQVQNGKVINVIVGDPADFPALIDVTGQSVSKGWGYDSETGAVSQPPGPPELPKLNVSNVSTDDPNDDIQPQEWTFIKGSTVSGDVTLKDAQGNVVDVSATFRMPLIASDGRERIMRLTLANGTGSFSATVEESGVWQVTAGQINKRLPRGERMDIDPITIYVGIN